jgi:glycosyltransferase involved in cell wall biosynthesis
MDLKKKIAVLCDYHLMQERIGGMDLFFWAFDAECKALGHEITWFFPNNEAHEGYANLSIIAAEGKSIEQTFLVYEQSFDLVFTHFLELCTPFYKAVKKQNLATKIIAVDHNPRPFNGYPLKKRIQKRIKGLIYASFVDLFVGVSQYTVNEILKDFGPLLKNRTKVVYNGITYQKFKRRTSRSSQKPTFVVACHLRYSKGIQDLIEAVALLPKEIVSSLFIDVYGEGEYQSTLESLISKHHLEGHFVFKGSVANLYEIFHLYDYMLQPTHMECFSLAILESLSANVPVITTPVGGTEEVIKNGVNGYILPVQSPKKWSAMIEKIYMVEEKINTTTSDLIENEFSIEKMVANYIKLL